MNRPLIFIAAMATAAAAVTSACLAEVRSSDRPFRADDIRFTLSDENRDGRLDFSLREGDRRSHLNNTVAAADIGADPSVLARDGAMRFAMVRDAGRLDCEGTTRAAKAEGNCRFTADEAFNRELAAAGVARPSAEDSYAMTIVGVTRTLVVALKNANYGPPDADQLTAMAAVGVTPAYIADLSQRGFKPGSLDDLVAFRAVGVTPDYVDGLAKAGVKVGEGDDVVALRALGVTPDFVAGFVRIGYTNLPAEKLVELKALGVTPAMVQTAEKGGNLPLVQREIVRNLRQRNRD